MCHEHGFTAGAFARQDSPLNSSALNLCLLQEHTQAVAQAVSLDSTGMGGKHCGLQYPMKATGSRGLGVTLHYQARQLIAARLLHEEMRRRFRA